jgi:hypothetical protein
MRPGPLIISNPDPIQSRNTLKLSKINKIAFLAIPVIKFIIGFTKEEREGFTQLLGAGFIDSFR